MGMFEQFPYTNYHDLNLDWIIQKIKECYSPDNPPEFAVLSVNGETGTVILYREAAIQFPSVDNTTWNMFRSANGKTTGIQFVKDQPAQRINGTSRFDMYDAGNPPPYPVSSVDGQTGNVQTWANTGNDTVTLPHGSEGDSWAMRREVPSGYLGIEFELDDNDDPTGYFILKPENASIQRIKILTASDIPSSSGVVSVNGEAGVVVLTGADLHVSTTDTRPISTAINSIIDDEYMMDNAITYTERGDNATQNIPLGKYVIWKNRPYVTIAAISVNDALGSGNLSSLNHGIVDNLLTNVNNLTNNVNSLNDQITTLNGNITSDAAWAKFTTATLESGISAHQGIGVQYTKYLNLVIVYIYVSGLTANTRKKISSLPSGYRPLADTAYIGMGGSSYTAKAFFQIEASAGNIYVTSDDAYAQGYIMFWAK